MAACNENPSVSTSSSTTSAAMAVVYFSVTSNTKAIAEKIKALVLAEIYQILPTNLFMETDLNYNDSSSVATKEQNDASCRPEISSPIDISFYSAIFLGYPVWWGQAPKIMYTLQSHIPF